MQLICVSTASVMAHVCAASVFYVSPTGAHHPPFDHPDNAATNIQSAVNVATNAGDTVVVRDGIYYVAAPVAVADAITIVGENGPQNTIVDGSGSTHCFELDDVGCTLSGLTITNGYNSADGGGIVCDGGAPVITNCIVAGNHASSGGGILGGTVHHSIIRDNVAENMGGGIYGTAAPAMVYDSLIVFNVASNDYGGGAEFCDLYNCTIVGNSAPDTGGADNCNIYNSIVYSNAASMNGNVAYSYMDSSCVESVGSDTSGSYIKADPMFVDFASGDYRLQTNSPCINAGDNSYVINGTDLDANPRISRLSVDMGAYEYQFPLVDTDGDGMLDYEEEIAGTNPTNPASYFAVTNWSAGSFIIEWPAFSNREYRVYHTESLTNGFQQVGAVIYYPQNSYTDSASRVSGFYKVEVQLQ